MSSVGTVHLYIAGVSQLNILRPAAFAQRTGKARFLFVELWNHTSGTGGRLCSPNLRFWRPALSIELHPYMCASRLIVTRRISAPIAELWRSFQRALSFSLRTCATLRSSGSYPASGGTSRPCPALALRATRPSLAVTSPFWGCLCSACPRLSGVSAPWPLEQLI